MSICCINRIDMKNKKLAKKIVSLMSLGELPEQVAAGLDMDIDAFNERINSSKKLQKAYKLGYTKLMGFHIARMNRLVENKLSTNDKAMTLFYSHFLDIIEKKPQQSTDDENISHSTEFE